MIVYLVTNMVNGKYYVGKTYLTLNSRWAGHKCEARKRPITHFHKAIRKYGDSVFALEVLCSSNSRDELSNLEKLWIISLKAYDKNIGYNGSYGGEGSSPTEETKNKISNTLKARYKINPPSFPNRQPLTEDHKRKISTSLSGRVFSEIHRIQLSIAANGNNNQRPRKHSNETRQKLKAAWIARKARAGIVLYY